MATPETQPVSTDWIWLSAVPVLGVIVPLVTGVRLRRWSWVALGVGLIVVNAAYLALNDQGGDGSTADGISTALFAAAWVTGIAFGGFARSPYARAMRLVNAETAHEDLHAGRNAERNRARRLAAGDPAEALRRGVGRPDLPDADHGHVIDVNHAPASVLQTLPGVDEDLARRIVANREAVGPATSIDDLGLTLDLDARTVERLKAMAVAVDI